VNLPIDVFPIHEIQGKDSCTSWAIEFILKVHDKIGLTEYPVQKKYPEGIGFGEKAKNLLAARQIFSWEESFEWLEFGAISKEDAASGLPLIFSLPTSVSLNFQPVGFDTFRTYHACIALHSAEAPMPYIREHFDLWTKPISALLGRAARCTFRYRELLKRAAACR
jgi:hypothetical protein